MYINLNKILLKLIITSILVLFSSLASANQVDFYGEKSNTWDIVNQNNTNILNSSLESFYKKTGLNTDIIIIGKGDSCYLKSNFDSCIQKRENYSSDLIIVLSMKSDIKSRGDIRSLIKDEFKESITPRELKILQDNITIYFKNNNFTKGLNSYLKSLENLIEYKCNEVGISKDKCDAVKLAKEYYSYVTQKQAEAKYNAFIRIIYIIISIILIILGYLGLRLFYKRSLNNLYKDTKYKIKSISEFDLFDKDKKSIIIDFESLKKVIKQKLGDLDKNVFTLRSFYKKQKSKYLKIEADLQKKQKLFNNREELKDKVSNLKNIDL